MKSVGTRWQGKIDGVECVFNIIGTYGSHSDPDPIITIDEGDSHYLHHKVAINWYTGEVIKDFGLIY